MFACLIAVAALLGVVWALMRINELQGDINELQGDIESIRRDARRDEKRHDDRYWRLYSEHAITRRLAAAQKLTWTKHADDWAKP